MIPVIICLAAVFVALVAQRAGWRGVRAMAKLTASSAVVWAAVAWGAPTTLYGRLLLLGLLLCWIGDALLIPSGKARWFRLGALAFLLGHLAYATAFSRLVDFDPIVFAAAVIGVCLAVWSVIRWLGPHLDSRLRRLVGAYVAAISIMVAASLAAVGSGGPAVIGLGAAGFALSDVAVARDRLVSRGSSSSTWGLPLYFLAQMALAYSVSQLS
jgi:uncharacterized membrane protein YhhN